MRVTRRVFAGILAAAATSRRSLAFRRTNQATEALLAASQISASEQPSVALTDSEKKTAKDVVQSHLKDKPQTLASLSTLLPKVPATQLKRYVEYLVGEGEVEEWDQPRITAKWYMDADALDDLSDSILEKTDSQGQKLSVLAKNLPTIKPDIVAVVVAYMIQDHSLRRVDGSTDDDPIIANEPRRHGG